MFKFSFSHLAFQFLLLFSVLSTYALFRNQFCRKSLPNNSSGVTLLSLFLLLFAQDRQRAEIDLLPFCCNAKINLKFGRFCLKENARFSWPLCSAFPFCRAFEMSQLSSVLFKNAIFINGIFYRGFRLCWNRIALKFHHNSQTILDCLEVKMKHVKLKDAVKPQLKSFSFEILFVFMDMRQNLLNIKIFKFKKVRKALPCFHEQLTMVMRQTLLYLPFLVRHGHRFQ